MKPPIPLLRLALLACSAALLLPGCSWYWGMKFNNDGIRQYELGNQWNAIESYSRSVARVTSASRTYNNRGLSHYLVGNYSQALEDFNFAVEMNEDKHRTYNNRGVLFHQLGEDERAMEDYLRATEVELEYSEPYFNRALLYMTYENYEMALRNIEPAIFYWREDNDEEWPEALFMKALIAEHLGDWETAWEYYELAEQAREDSDRQSEEQEEQENTKRGEFHPVKPVFSQYRPAIIE